MTLIVAIPARDAVVFGSDSQVTAGAVRATAETKIFQLNNRALWAASGELALIQRVAEKIDGFPNKGEPLAAIRDNLATFVKEAVEALLLLDFRTQFLRQDPNALLQLHPGDFLFVEYHNDRPWILHVMSNGTPEWVEGRIAATGNGSMFAHALLQKYAGLLLGRNEAKLILYKVIEEAIDVGAYGLGSPVHIWEVSGNGVKETTEEEIAALRDSARVLRESEVSLLETDADAQEQEVQEGVVKAIYPTN